MGRTDENGDFTLENLPVELPMWLDCEPLDEESYAIVLRRFYLEEGENRPREICRLAGPASGQPYSLARSYKSQLRDASLGDFYLLVIGCTKDRMDFVNREILDYASNPPVASFLNLVVNPSALSGYEDRVLAESNKWISKEKVLLCVLDPQGAENARIEIDPDDATSRTQAISFIRKHAPPQADAEAKWDAAFAEAKRSERKVWARVSQRYCGPCFLFSRWLDENRELLERDYVFLKVDDVRDRNGIEVANRIVGGRSRFGVPFHSIFSVDEKVIIDSESKLGNVGFPGSFEGQRHVTKMLEETSLRLTTSEIEAIVESLRD
ncbi:MAG: thioredoxin family protein [Planctomycetota bacterium]